MEVKTLGPVVLEQYCVAGKLDQMCATVGGSVGVTVSPRFIMAGLLSTSASNYTFNKDTGYDAIYEKFVNAADSSEWGASSVEADKYILEYFWVLNTIPVQDIQPGSPILRDTRGRKCIQVKTYG